MDIWPAPPAWRKSIENSRRVVITVAGLISLAALIVHHGFPADEALVAQARRGYVAAAVGLALELVLAAWSSPRPAVFLRRRLAPITLLVLFVAQLLLLRFGGQERDRLLTRLEVGGLAQAYLVALQFYIAGGLLLAIARVNRRISSLRLAPGRMVLALFLALIAVGTLLMRLPRVTPSGSSLPWLDAAFTATSAVCVTGLTVIDASRALAPTGQAILALLIQLGGLGIMAFTGFLAVVTGLGLGIRERAVLADVLHTEVASQVARHLRTMVVVTFAIEAVGMLALVRPFAEVAPERDAWALAAFHSVSAFCNAGFSTLDGNLVRATAAVRVNAVIMTLIALGGLGFSTLVLTSTWLVQRARRHRIQLRMSVRLVWITSAWLWVGGTVALVVLEWGGALSGLSPAHRFLVAAFHSVTARTAGFNTIDISAFSGASLLVLMLLMYVGGAPGSTAGGIKVTTVAVMLGVVRSTLRGDGRVVVGGREIHEASLREAIAVVFVGGLVVVVALGILLCVEPLPFLPLAFESVSALGTVGLSLGITPQLSGVGKVVLMLLMLVGRVGPLTLVLAVGRAVAARERYPTERVPVG